LPEPLAPEVTVIHAAALLTAVHAHPLALVTVIEPVVPAAGADRLAGEIAYVHVAAAAACVTVTVWPATVNVPVREVVAVLAATLYPTFALPAPLVVSTVIQLALLLAPQLQLEPVVTLTAPLVAAAPGVALSGDTTKLHPLVVVTSNAPMSTVPCDGRAATWVW